MIPEATRNARAAADGSPPTPAAKSDLSAPRKGYFRLFLATRAAILAKGQNYGPENGDSIIMKKVRVVTTAQYYLEK
jgi:hypothetical protein